METKHSMIVAENLGKAFEDLRRGQIVAVENLSFTAKPGEIFGLLGPNGAGKTTTMRMLSTVLKPTSGRAEVAGFNVVTHPSEVRASIGFLSGSTNLYDRMSAWEHVEFFGKLYGMSGDLLAERMEKLFASLRMNDCRDVLVSKMSTGMKQKVSIGRTIIHDPPVLIFDEPTSGLDVMVARVVLDYIQQLRDEGKCILYSTHIMSEVDSLCRRLAVIAHGNLVAVGDREDLLAEHGVSRTEDLIVRLLDGQPV